MTEQQNITQSPHVTLIAHYHECPDCLLEQVCADAACQRARVDPCGCFERIMGR